MRTTLKSFMINQDVSGFRTHLATYRQSTSSVQIAEILESFLQERYNPPNDTIKSFAIRLRKTQELLDGTINILTDDNLRMRLAKQFVLNQYPTFKDVVRYLQSAANTENKSSQAGNANVYTGSHGGNQRGRESRRGRRRGRVETEVTPEAETNALLSPTQYRRTSAPGP